MKIAVDDFTKTIAALSRISKHGGFPSSSVFKLTLADGRFRMYLGAEVNGVATLPFASEDDPEFSVLASRDHLCNFASQIAGGSSSVRLRLTQGILLLTSGRKSARIPVTSSNPKDGEVATVFAEWDGRKTTELAFPDEVASALGLLVRFSPVGIISAVPELACQYCASKFGMVTTDSFNIVALLGDLFRKDIVVPAALPLVMDSSGGKFLLAKDGTMAVSALDGKVVFFQTPPAACKKFPLSKLQSRVQAARKLADVGSFRLSELQSATKYVASFFSGVDLRNLDMTFSSTDSKWTVVSAELLGLSTKQTLRGRLESPFQFGVNANNLVAWLDGLEQCLGSSAKTVRVSLAYDDAVAFFHSEVEAYSYLLVSSRTVRSGRVAGAAEGSLDAGKS